MIHAYANNNLTNEIIDSVDLNLPPGVLTKMAQKAGICDKINEMAILDIINRRLAPKFREMICQQSLAAANAPKTSSSGESAQEQALSL